ncbi:bridge-like lipid transfer protein family member 1 [Dysidea avara]|uniref:bridge-like lipid transfer protein family member 1 n=1 Tax=Dysidea avara TaxID=196820 RepID=UPI00331D8EDD
MDDTTSEGGSCGTTTHALLTLPVVLSVLWTLFCLFYHTRLLALLLSWLTNRFLNDSHVTIGSVRVSLFAGRILFTNVRYTTLDYSVSIVDGYASLKWWKGAQKVYRDWKEVELFLQLNGIRFHWYNRTEAYKEVERKFQKQWHASPGDDVSGLSTETEASGHSWMGITPRITCNMKKVKIVLGNSQVLDHNLVIYMNKGLFTYSYQLASCVYDEYRYVMGCEGTEVEAYWEPNKGTSDRVVFGRSRDASLLYTVDMPGPTPNNRQSIEVKHPEFTMELNFGGSSEIHAGPAIHRYRTELQRFFFPNDCCDAEVTRFPSEGEKRIYNQFVITVTLQDGGHIVLPFATKKDDGMASLTFSVDPRSYLKIILPWITYNDGYTSVVEGLFRSPSLKTSLAYQPVGQAQYAKLRTDLHFPRIWNGLQTWDMHVTLDQLNCNILFPYIDFIGDLLDDWNTGPPSDLMTFVPVQWQVAVQLSCYEVFLYTNHYNWMDVSGMARNENCRLAVCGKTGTLNFEFPFTDFLPVEQKINFSAEGQNLALRRYVPPSCTTKESIFALSSINKHRWRWPSHLHTQEAGAYDSSRERFPLGWVQNTTYQDGWVDLACSQAISIQVKYSSFANCVERENGVRPNVLKVEVEVPDIVLRIFGVLVRDLLGLKGNYTGDFPNLTVFDSTDSQSSQPEEISPKATADFAPPLLTDNCYDSVEHFLEIYITFRLPNGTIEFPVHLPRDTDGQNLPLPSGHADLLQVEFAYQQYDTRVAINVEAVSILVPTQGCLDGKTILGQLTIPSVMFRGHGLNETLYKERVEYAWIMDLDVGRVEGALATEQVLVVVDWLQSTVAHVTSPGDEMVVAPGGVLEEPLVEPLVGIMKYRVFTVSVCPCDVTLMEGNHLLRLTVPGFGLAACNLQGDEATWGVTFLLHGIQSHIYVSPEYPLSNFSSSVPSLL